MKTKSLNELKKELSLLTPNEIVEISMKLVRYKKENKELLHYLLFYAHYELTYIDEVKKEITFLFKDSLTLNFYLSKKTIRKVLKIANNYIRYSKLKQTEVEIRLHFCTEIKKAGLLYHADKSFHNLYQKQLERISKAMEKLHEDLQHDYQEELNALY